MNRSRGWASLLLVLCMSFSFVLSQSAVAWAETAATHTLSLNPDASEYAFARIPDRQVQEGSPVGNLPVLSRSGYNFGGWYTGEIGEGQCYTASTVMPAHDVELFAYWYVGAPLPGHGYEALPGGVSSGLSGEGGPITSVVLGDGTDTSVQIPRNELDKLVSEGGALTIVTDTAALVFDSAAVETIGDASAAGDLTLSIGVVEYQDQEPQVQAVTGGRPAYDFTLWLGETHISGFGEGTATIRILYELGPEEEAAAVVVYYVDDAGRNPHLIKGAYNAETCTVDFPVTHFSTYAVGYNKVDFTDVPQDSASYEAVTFCAARGITNGTGNGEFSPGLPLTRGQFIVMCMRAWDISPDSDPEDNFVDAGNTYYTGYLAAAKRLGISNGVGDNRYAPDEGLTSQDMLTLLFRTLDALGQLPEAGTVDSLDNYADSPDVSEYARPAMELFVSRGVIEGQGNLMLPKAETLRSVMVQVLHNLLAG